MNKADKANAVGGAVMGLAGVVVAYVPSLAPIMGAVTAIAMFLFGWAAPQAGSSSKFTNVARDE